MSIEKPGGPTGIGLQHPAIKTGSDSLTTPLRSSVGERVLALLHYRPSPCNGLQWYYEVREQCLR